MENTSAERVAQDLLSACLDGRPTPPGAVDRLIQPDANRALFSIVVEGLADRFEPRLCDRYAELFSEVIARTVQGNQAQELLDRYRRIRRPRRFDVDPARIENVFALSRVTLGADVAVTSIVLDAAKRLFPHASIYFVGPEKSWELFAADPMLEHVPLAYGRSGGLAGRLSVWPLLREAVSSPRSIVIDPDSRLTQLGLLPICPDENYFFFESRAYGGNSEASLSELTQGWIASTFEVVDAQPFIAPLRVTADPADITISLGVGDNLTKRTADPFEEDLLRFLAEHESSILIDRGAGGEEAIRVERATARSGGRLQIWDGSFAGFAAQITRSGLYIGYDSAGGHVAAVSGVPLISIFSGFVSERMFQRWRPTGNGPIHIVRAADPESTLSQVTEIVSTRIHGAGR